MGKVDFEDWLASGMFDEILVDLEANITEVERRSAEFSAWCRPFNFENPSPYFCSLVRRIFHVRGSRLGQFDTVSELPRTDAGCSGRSP
jgi:hypothetical protein